MKRGGDWSGVSWEKITQYVSPLYVLRIVMLTLEITLSFKILDDLAGICFGG